MVQLLANHQARLVASSSVRYGLHRVETVRAGDPCHHRSIVPVRSSLVRRASGYHWARCRSLDCNSRRRSSSRYSPESAPHSCLKGQRLGRSHLSYGEHLQVLMPEECR